MAMTDLFSLFGASFHPGWLTMSKDSRQIKEKAYLINIGHMQNCPQKRITVPGCRCRAAAAANLVPLNGYNKRLRYFWAIIQ